MIIMSSPLFQAPIFSPPRRGEPYQPAEPPASKLEWVKADMRSKQIQVTPDNIRHALEAEEIRELLEQVGIDPAKKVSATRDCSGMVKVTFEEFRRVLRATVAVHTAEGSS
jgi:hypothetical protein